MEGARAPGPSVAVLARRRFVAMFHTGRLPNGEGMVVERKAPRRKGNTPDERYNQRMSDVKIYTTNYCGYCARAKALLTERGIAFEDIDVTGDAGARAMLVEKTGRHTVPQIFINGQAIGGCDELFALDASGGLQRMLAG